MGEGWRLLSQSELGFPQCRCLLGVEGLLTLGPEFDPHSRTYGMTEHLTRGAGEHEAWYRDSMRPCGMAFSLSNGLAVTFAP